LVEEGTNKLQEKGKWSIMEKTYKQRIIRDYPVLEGENKNGDVYGTKE